MKIRCLKDLGSVVGYLPFGVDLAVVFPVAGREGDVFDRLGMLHPAAVDLQELALHQQVVRPVLLGGGGTTQLLTRAGVTCRKQPSNNGNARIFSEGKGPITQMHQLLTYAVLRPTQY